MNKITNIQEALSLSSQCLTICVKHPQYALIQQQDDNDSMDIDSEDNFAVQSYDKSSEECIELKTHQFIPYKISEQLFQMMVKNHPERLLYIFTNPNQCHLTRINLRIEETLYPLHDQNLLSKLFMHPLREINLSGQVILPSTLSSLQHCADTLKVLDLSSVPGLKQCSVIKSLYRLEKLNLQNTDIGYKNEQLKDIGNLPNLQCLNLAETDIDNDSLEELLPLSKTLAWFSLYCCNGVTNVEALYQLLRNFRRLVYLDISKELDQDNQEFIENQQTCNETTKLLCSIASLPNLTYLDLSGSSLIKYDDLQPFQHPREKLKFLGLSKTGLCYNTQLPAEKVTGEANEEQILTSLEVYGNRTKYVAVALRRLFNLASHHNCVQVERCLRLILKSMTTFKDTNGIHIAATASLYHLTREELPFAANPDPQLRRDIITTLLDSMENLKPVLQLQKNICLTLCNFKIPMEVDFQYTRLADLLLAALQKHRDDYLRRVAIMLFNAIVCQNAGNQKKEMGLHGAIETILQIIAEKIESAEADNLLETCWSSLWNITDETPENCEDFLSNDGMRYFVQCLQLFPQSLELHRNMMGLMGNVAEVPRLRKVLMTEEYLSLFVLLLNKEVEGLEVSYNSAGLLSHILSDGPQAWTITTLTRDACMNKIIESIESWDLDANRNINYRSFKPILRLLTCFDASAAQHWAAWALANLTKVYPFKYCKLIEEEGGLLLLMEIVNADSASVRIKQLSQLVVDHCHRELCFK